MHLRVACARALARREFAWRIAAPKEPRDGKGQQVTLYFRRETRRWLKKKFISTLGESIRCSGGRREGDDAPSPLKYLCRMTSHFWNPAVYYKVLCTGTMTRAQTVTEATVITRKMVVRSRRVGSLHWSPIEKHAVKGAAFVPDLRETSVRLYSNYSNLRWEIASSSRDFHYNRRIRNANLILNIFTRLRLSMQNSTSNTLFMNIL